MNYVKNAVIATVTLVTIAVGASAYAERDGNRSGFMMERVSKQLELDDTQTAALETLRDELSQMRELMKGADGSDMKTQMSELIAAETFDQAAALALINDRTAAIQANAPELVAAAAVFFDGLSAEQKAQIQSFAEKRGRHGHGH